MKTYWNNAGGQHTMSSGVRSMRSPMLLPLFKMFVCVRQAAFGTAVVPDVNCMLTMSS
jgi:hypothetical protein